MDTMENYDHILIREGTVVVRIPTGVKEITENVFPEFFDTRTGVGLKRIFPPLQTIELHRGRLLNLEDAASILRYPAMTRKAKVVTLLEIRQRKLDSVVADSILDQVKLIALLLTRFSETADKAEQQERLWLSQQVLTLVRKFTGRELTELEEIMEWFDSSGGK